MYTLFLMLILCGSVCNQILNENMPSVNEFNISELNLFNNMVSCVAKFKLQFVNCNRQLQKLGKLLHSYYTLLYHSY